MNYFEYDERRTNRRAVQLDVIDVPDIMVMEREPTQKDLELLADTELQRSLEDPWHGAR